MFGLFKKKPLQEYLVLKGGSSTKGYRLEIVISRELCTPKFTKLKVTLRNPVFNVRFIDAKTRSIVRLVQSTHIEKHRNEIRVYYEEVHPCKDLPLIKFYTIFDPDDILKHSDERRDFALGEKKYLEIDLIEDPNVSEDSTTEIWQSFDECFKSFDKIQKAFKSS